MAKQEKAQPPRASLIQPLVQAAGETHILQKLQDQKTPPILKAIGYAKVGEGAHPFVSYVVTFQGEKVLSIEVSDPDMRQIAEDQAKMSFVEQFVDKENH